MEARNVTLLVDLGVTKGSKEVKGGWSNALNPRKAENQGASGLR